MSWNIETEYLMRNLPENWKVLSGFQGSTQLTTKNESGNNKGSWICFKITTGIVINIIHDNISINTIYYGHCPKNMFQIRSNENKWFPLRVKLINESVHPMDTVQK